MADEINAVEIFEIAQQIERDAAAFYQEAALNTDNPEGRELLWKLAEWELQHERKYAKMKRHILDELKDKNVRASASGEYKALASLSVFAMEADPLREFTSKTSLLEILEEAIRKEKDSIHYFEALFNFAADKTAVKQIERVIEEEKHHVATLQESLEKLKRRGKTEHGHAASE
jgi:rubrerythrin